jgi:hypothetical protein
MKRIVVLALTLMGIVGSSYAVDIKTNLYKRYKILNLIENQTPIISPQKDKIVINGQYNDSLKNQTTNFFSLWDMNKGVELFYKENAEFLTFLEKTPSTIIYKLNKTAYYYDLKKNIEIDSINLDPSFVNFDTKFYAKIRGKASDSDSLIIDTYDPVSHNKLATFVAPSKEPLIISKIKISDNSNWITYNYKFSGMPKDLQCCYINSKLGVDREYYLSDSPQLCESKDLIISSDITNASFEIYNAKTNKDSSVTFDYSIANTMFQISPESNTIYISKGGLLNRYNLDDLKLISTTQLGISDTNSTVWFDIDSKDSAITYSLLVKNSLGSALVFKSDLKNRKKLSPVLGVVNYSDKYDGFKMNGYDDILILSSKGSKTVLDIKADTLLGVFNQSFYRYDSESKEYDMGLYADIAYDRNSKDFYFVYNNKLEKYNADDLLNPKKIELNIKDSLVGCISISSDGKRFAIGDKYSSIYLYELQSLKVKKVFDLGHGKDNSYICDYLALSQDGEYLYGGHNYNKSINSSFESQIALWHLSSVEPIFNKQFISMIISNRQFTNNFNFGLVDADIYNINNLWHYTTLESEDGIIDCKVSGYSYKDDYVIAVASSGELQFWDGYTQKRIPCENNKNYWIKNIAISNVSNTLVLKIDSANSKSLCYMKYYDGIGSVENNAQIRLQSLSMKIGESRELTLSGEYSEAIINAYDESGASIDATGAFIVNENKLRINTNNMRPGAYIVSVVEGGKKENIRIMITE